MTDKQSRQQQRQQVVRSTTSHDALTPQQHAPTVRYEQRAQREVVVSGAVAVNFCFTR